MEGSFQPPGSRIPQCCCGRFDCPFLAHTGTLLEGLERDVQTAAQLGQALLVRHEAYMADAEQERLLMTSTIETLEQQKRELEERNAQTVEENRNLLDQLEGLNDAVAESDAQVKSLTATLQSTQEELQRLFILAARTENLENQLAQLERDQAQLQDTLTAAVEDERTAIQRWRQAERTIGDLQDQIDRIEREAREERERHVEVVGRMERRRAVEIELETAAGRLKGAAAARTGGREKNGSNVVSHFVKDILQDNASLQMGIVELREMLLNSNEEVERLREQLQAHQPILLDENIRTPSLQKELGSEPTINQELHVHHHYHAPPEPKEEFIKTRTHIHRRARKKRNVVTTGHFTPPASAHTPRSSVSKISAITPSPKTATSTSSSAAILSQTFVTIPQSSHRWSIHSNQTGTSIAASSAPGSPYSSSHRASSIFDRVFNDTTFDSSRPTSPESNDPGSPLFLPSSGSEELAGKLESVVHKKPQRSGSQGLKLLSCTPIRSISLPITKSTLANATITEIGPRSERINNHRDIDDLYLTPSGQPTIPEENEDTSERDSLSTPTPPSDISTEDIYSHMQTQPSLRRVASHESLISISGMDIHTLRSRPSQLLLPNNPRFTSPSTSVTSSKPVLSAMTATATRASMSRRNLDSSTYNRSLLYGMAAEQRGGLKTKEIKETLGQRVGGWVFGKWGFTPTSSSSTTSRVSSNLSSTSNKATGVNSREDNITRSSGEPSTSSSESTAPVQSSSPGLTQPAPSFGLFGPDPITQCEVVVNNIDEQALKELLGES
ncbi:hypothetical protein AOQ84DRAFT_431152 [Glonium stellatum]|uniref:Uncharacterized protein n=1 Tax=Glonium stellatum TaxID=574774 RepID=A0A8E2JU84_9PEZI|nr:hypothetical protein AOQ84DRAFT_431152 [Glonium stellatum]